MNKALFISMHQLGVQNGGSIASGNFLKVALKAFEGSVRVVASAESVEYVKALGVLDFQPVGARSTLQKLSCLFRGVCSDRFTPYVDIHLLQLLEGVSHVILDGSMIGRFAPMVKAISPEMHVTQLHHNCERKFYSDTKMPWWLRLFMKRVIDNNQGGGWRAADLNLTFTEQDKTDLTQAYGEPLRGKAVVFGYYEECGKLEVLNEKQVEDSLRLVITGNMSVPKGYAGAVWFVEEILPKLQGVSLVIAGRNPHEQLIEACARCRNVELIANPEDMQAILREADVFVNPSSIGSGIKVRNFDGLRNGLPVICHEGNVHGFEHLPDDVFAAFTDAGSFIHCFDRMRQTIKRGGLRGIVLHAYQANFGLEAGAKKIREYLG
ncbi:MAG: glycosyltransferase [Opitutae bacterium]|jgi:glycosyltransferase involved in cell wall biosynthesis|nr:glycosyltransferase [Opitutae bacterium]